MDIHRNQHRELMTDSMGINIKLLYSGRKRDRYETKESLRVLISHWVPTMPTLFRRTSISIGRYAGLATVGDVWCQEGRVEHVYTWRAVELVVEDLVCKYAVVCTLSIPCLFRYIDDDVLCRAEDVLVYSEGGC